MVAGNQHPIWVLSTTKRHQHEVPFSPTTDYSPFSFRNSYNFLKMIRVHASILAQILYIS